MKKILLAGLFLLAVPSFAMAAPTVTITSPNGGETLTVGSVAHITWNSTNSDKVMLGYSSCSSCLDWITSGTVSNTGSYDWTVNVGNTTNTQFKIYVTAYQTGVGSVYDYSDNYFTVNKASTVSATPAITSISPSQIAVGTTAVTLYGKNFNSTLVIALTGPGADTTVTPTYVSSDGMSMTFNFPATITTPGTYSVQVANYGVPIYSSINVTLVGTATNFTPAITSASKNTTSDLSFTIYGTNLASVGKLQYIDTINNQSGELSGSKIKSASSNEVVFYQDLSMVNSLSLYKIKVVDSQGNMSNEASLDLRSSLTPSPVLEIFFKILSISEGKPLIAGQQYPISWISGKDNKDEEILLFMSSASGQKGSSGVLIGKTQLTKDSFLFTVPENTASGDYIVSANNSSASLYANSPTFTVQGKATQTSGSVMTTSPISGCVSTVGFSSTTGKSCATGNTTIAPTSSTSGADVDTSGQASSCVDLSNNMRYRMRDASVNNEVSDLQDFLNSKGFLKSEPTGFFGLATLKAVKAYQSSIGLSPTGYVGPLTRTNIKTVTCSATE